MIDIKKITLPNKSRIVLAPIKSVETVTVMILFRAGSRYETKDISGIAHFLEHMFFKGGEKYPDAHSVAETIDSVGGAFNAFTGNEFVGYYVKVAKEHIETAFDLLSDMMMQAKFPEDGLERERGVILEEMKMYRDSPTSHIYQEWETMILGDQPMGWPIIGEEAVINKVRREDFVHYKEKFYTAPNLVVAVAGNTSAAQITSLVKKYFPLPKEGKKNQPVPYRMPIAKKRIQLINRKIEQAHLVLGVPTFGEMHADRPTAMVLASLLGGGMSSRLFMNVREKHGLAYYISAYAQHYTDAGYLAIRAGVDVKRLDLAITTILEELKKVKMDTISPKELKKSKEQVLGSVMLSLESSDEVAIKFGLGELLEDKIESIEAFKKKINKVTSAQVKALAQKLFVDKNLNLSVIGPYKSTEKIEKVYKL